MRLTIPSQESSNKKTKLKIRENFKFQIKFGRKTTTKTQEKIENVFCFGCAGQDKEEENRAKRRYLSQYNLRAI